MDNRQSCTGLDSRLLVSACLLGEPVRYDARSKPVCNPDLDKLIQQGRVIPFCPEVAGGLTTPREPAEIRLIKNKRQVITASGNDVTAAFLEGAQKTLKLCQRHGIQVAILTELSPSCGSSQIYDGSFSRKPVNDMGVTTSLLRRHGIKVFSQNQIGEALAMINQADSELSSP